MSPPRDGLLAEVERLRRELGITKAISFESQSDKALAGMVKSLTARLEEKAAADAKAAAAAKPLTPPAPGAHSAAEEAGTTAPPEGSGAPKPSAPSGGAGPGTTDVAEGSGASTLPAPAGAGHGATEADASTTSAATPGVPPGALGPAVALSTAGPGDPTAVVAPPPAAPAAGPSTAVVAPPPAAPAAGPSLGALVPPWAKSVQESLARSLARTEPPPDRHAAAAPAYRVAHRKSVSSGRGIIAPGEAISADDLEGGQQSLDLLVAGGVVVRTE